ncbi:MAG: hypothetical protein WBF53_15750 [Litorimonas sp.]
MRSGLQNSSDEFAAGTPHVSTKDFVSWRIAQFVFVISLFLIALFWASYILEMKPGHYYSKDDLNFFGPRTAAYLRGDDNAFWSTPQGPHLHIGYKLQSVLLMKHFNWNSHLLALAGIYVLCAFAWFGRHRWEVVPNTESGPAKRPALPTALVWLLVNMAFALALIGHLNVRSFGYTMLLLNNPLITVSGAIMLYSFAALLAKGSQRQFAMAAAFIASTIFIFWGIAIAISPFFMAALAAMGAVAFVLNFIKRRKGGDASMQSISAVLKSLRLPIAGGLAALILALAYFAYVSATPRSGTINLEGIDLVSLVPNISYVTTGLSVLGIKASLFSTSITMALLALSLLVLAQSRFLGTTNKLFLLGVFVLVVTFSTGTVLLRGASALMSPRYIPTIGTLYIAIVWCLGQLVWRALHATDEPSFEGSARRSFELGTGIALLLISVAFSVAGFSIVADRSGTLKRYHQIRADFVLHAPIDLVTLNPRHLGYCSARAEICKTEVLRMRCFDRKVPYELCISGSSDELLSHLEALAGSRPELLK